MSDSLVKVSFGPLTIIRLNRPKAINSLNLEMIRLIHKALEHARTLNECRCVMFEGAGEKGFCAGGDIRSLWSSVKCSRYEEAEKFFHEEYGLDLYIHEYPKPVIVFADGITMGGGIGIAEGADIIIATERTLMAMPETRIGFFPDVGATGWLNMKCPPGYPGFIALTGYEMFGYESVRLGLSTHFTKSSSLGKIKTYLFNIAPSLPKTIGKEYPMLDSIIETFSISDIPAQPEMDAWVAEHFTLENSMEELIESLRTCKSGKEYCEEFLQEIEGRSPTSLRLTHTLLKRNFGHTLKEVFKSESRAASFMIRQPDFVEGVRARIIDKDDMPVWNPPSIKAVEEIPLF
jgi:enoyl-CoA hydratase